MSLLNGAEALGARRQVRLCTEITTTWADRTTERLRYVGATAGTSQSEVVHKSPRTSRDQHRPRQTPVFLIFNSLGLESLLSSLLLQSAKFFEARIHPVLMMLNVALSLIDVAFAVRIQ